MKLEKIEDLLTIDTDKNKAQDNKNLLTKLKQLLKSDRKETTHADEIAEDFPYEGVGIVGNKLIDIKFDLESRKARVVDVSTDDRDNKGRNFMAADFAISKIERLARDQKEK